MVTQEICVPELLRMKQRHGLVEHGSYTLVASIHPEHKENEMDHTLRDTNGKTVTIAPLDILLRHLKHSVPDGDYSVEGPDVDATYYRIDGVVYPSGGMYEGLEMPPRSREECLAHPAFQMDATG